MGSWCTSIVTPGKMVGIVYTMRRMRKLPSYSKRYYTKSYTNIFDRWGYPSSACGKNNLDRLKLNELEQLKYKKRNKYNLIIILVDICSNFLEFIDFFGNFAWVKGHLITLPTFTQTGGREVGRKGKRTTIAKSTCLFLTTSVFHSAIQTTYVISTTSHRSEDGGQGNRQATKVVPGNIWWWQSIGGGFQKLWVTETSHVWLTFFTAPKISEHLGVIRR